MDKAKLTSSAPILLVKDVVKSATWYQEKLGFENPNFYGEPPDFCIISREKLDLMFSKADEKDIIPHWKVVEKMWNVYFWTDNVDALYKEFIDRGAAIDYSLYITTYGVKEFGISDPDGYDIAFGEILK